MADVLTYDTFRHAVNFLDSVKVPTPHVIYDTETTVHVPMMWDKWVLTNSIHDEWIATKKKPLIVIMVENE